MVRCMEEQRNFLDKSVFSDTPTFHPSGKANRHYVHICGKELQTAAVQHQRDSPKVNVFCAMFISEVYGPFSFMETAVTGTSYQDVLHCIVH